MRGSRECDHPFKRVAARQAWHLCGTASRGGQSGGRSGRPPSGAAAVSAGRVTVGGGVGWAGARAAP